MNCILYTVFFNRLRKSPFDTAMNSLMHKLLFALNVAINLVLFVGFATTSKYTPSLTALDSAIPLGVSIIGTLLLTLLIFRVSGTYLSRHPEWLDTAIVADEQNNYRLMTSFSLSVVLIFVPVVLALSFDNPAAYVYAVFMAFQAILTVASLLHANVDCSKPQPNGKS